MRSALAGWGLALPEHRRTNDYFESRLATTDGWIVERTGIRERRVAAPWESTATLGIDAGAAAITDAGLAPHDVDLLVVATVTPEQPIPHSGAFIGEGLGLRCGSFDLNAGCSGFVYALVVASGLLASGALRHVLVVGSETLTRLADPDDRGTVVLLGDAAAATIISATDALGGAADGPGLVAWDLGCDGSAAGFLEVRAGGSRRPTTADTVAAGDHRLRMVGREVFRRAVRAVVDSATATLHGAGVAVSDVDWFVPHQANARIIDAATHRLGIPLDRAVVNIDRYGNTSAASIPLALVEAADDGRLRDGDLVLLAGFGAGMTWASALVRWGRP